MIILKIGGGKGINLAGIAGDLARLEEEVIVVHGANAFRDELATQLGRATSRVTSVSGYASVLSDEPAIELLFMAYAGLRNKQIVQELQRAGVNAVGLSGLDGRVVQGRRNQGIRAQENGRVRILRDLSGKPQSVNRPLLQALLGLGCTPVLTVPIADESGAAINSENDDIVTVLQREMDAACVVQLIEAPGLLRDPSDPSSVIPALTLAELARWEAAAEGRIRRKLLALRRLLEGGTARVIVADGRGEHPVADALAGRGTALFPTGAEPAAGLTA
jgi:acetylglutamate/LysW-gamma-L-alpha-aminoadipate kinase